MQGSARLNFPGYAEPLSDHFWSKARPTPAPHSKKSIHSDRKAGYIGWYAGRFMLIGRLVSTLGWHASQLIYLIR